MKCSRSFITHNTSKFRSELCILGWNFTTDGETYTSGREWERRKMATKLTVALVGGVVIVVSIAILIIESLTSPSRCMPRSETSQTEGNFSPRNEFPPHSTNLPSLGDKFAKNSTSQLGTVLSTVNGVDEDVTSPSTEEEKSNRQSRDDGIVTVFLPASIAKTIHPGTTPLVSRRIIDVPRRNCGSGEKRDGLGICRKKWWLNQLTVLAMPNTR